VLRKQGLDPDSVPIQIANIAEQRDITRWLPLAFASLYRLVAAYGSKKPTNTTDLLRSWGLFADADHLDSILKTGREAHAEKTLLKFFAS